MSTMYNYRKLDNITLTPITENFLGCSFVCKSIATNIPDKFATSWKEATNNGFLIKADLYKLGKLIEKECDINIDTKNLHTIKSFSGIIGDISHQQILVRSVGKYYDINCNNYDMTNLKQLARQL